MSRAATKSRTEKAKTVQNAPTPSAVQDIIPGKYTENDWLDMLDDEENQLYNVTFVEEILESVLKQCFDKYIERQVIPYTVDCARRDILQVLEMQFLAYDHGECDINGDVTWELDEEPSSMIAECWAQGAVPVIRIKGDSASRCATPASHRSSRPTSAEQADSALEDGADTPDFAAELEKADETIGGLGPAAAVTQEPTKRGHHTSSMMESMKTMTPIDEVPEDQNSTTRNRSAHSLAASTPGPPGSGGPSRRPIPHPDLLVCETGKLPNAAARAMAAIDEQLSQPPVGKQKSTARRTKPKFRPVPKSRPSAIIEQQGAAHHSASLDGASVDGVKSKPKPNVPANKAIQYDADGNMVSMRRINADEMPSHIINTKFSVVDPVKSDADSIRRTGVQKGERRGSGADMAAPRKRGGRLGGEKEVKRAQHVDLANLEPELPPPLFEGVAIAPGVIVREGDRIHEGSQNRARKVDSLKEMSRSGGGELKPLSLQRPHAKYASTDMRKLLHAHKPRIDSVDGAAADCGTPTPPRVLSPIIKPRLGSPVQYSNA